MKTEQLLDNAINATNLQAEFLEQIFKTPEDKRAVAKAIDDAYHQAHTALVSLQELKNRAEGIHPPKEG